MSRLPPAVDFSFNGNGDGSQIPAPALDLIPLVKSRVGQLTAEAMQEEYESAAEAVEALGTELLAIKARMDKEAENIMTAIEAVNHLAKRYREEGKRISAVVDDCAKQTQRVRDVCADLTLPEDK